MCSLIGVVSCHPEQPDDVSWEMPEVVYPDNNPDSDASLELGGSLFFETLLSRDSSLSCQSCHLLTEAFADHLSVGLGIDNRTVTRNTPSLFNVGLHPYFMKDGKFASLEDQVLGPINDNREFDLSPMEVEKRIRSMALYNDFSQEAYGEDISIDIIQKALANFQRALISKNSAFDVYMAGDTAAISVSARKGWEMFKSNELNCISCHSGFDFSDYSFQNNGYFETYEDSGRALISKDDGDIGKFKVPSLRNVALTYPYMHDGSVATLREVIEGYMKGGNGHPNQSSRIVKFQLTEREILDLETFLQSLTELRLLEDQGE
jgi:cytochrome c peroxidase